MVEKEKPTIDKKRVLKIHQNGKVVKLVLPEVSGMSESSREIMEKVIERDYEALMELSRH